MSRRLCQISSKLEFNNGVGKPLLNSNSNGPLKFFVKAIIRLQNNVSNNVLMIQITQRNILLYYFLLYSKKPCIIEFLDHMGEILETAYIRHLKRKIDKRNLAKDFERIFIPTPIQKSLFPLP